MLSRDWPDMVSGRRRRGGPQTEISEEIVEKGDIYFAFRPRIEEDNPDPERAYAVDIETEHEKARKADIFRQLKMLRREHALPVAGLVHDSLLDAIAHGHGESD